jgi:hypothetical protein
MTDAQKDDSDAKPATGEAKTTAEENAVAETESNAAKSNEPTQTELPSKSPAPVESTKPDEKSAETVLQIDTQTQPKTSDSENNEQQNEDDKPPDTGTYTNDLDSLFGGPTSAGAGDGADFNMDNPNDNSVFDFGSFGNDTENAATDNDNLSALLPGLQDYANTQPTGNGEPDFDALFSTDMAGNADGNGNQQEDDTFADFMNFDDFGADYTQGKGEGENNDKDFDFNFD